MNEPQLFRVFISSPSDVRPERLVAERVVRRLAHEFAYHFRVEPVLWEREPLVAGEHFQQRIVPPRETEITVVILWSRLGVLLPEDQFRGPMSGTAVTGTAWEFEDALASYREKQLPDLLLYRKTAEVTGSLEDEEALRERLHQKRLVEEFMTRWTRSADGRSFTAASWSFGGTTEFEELLERHLRELIRRRITGDAGAPAGIRWHDGSPFRGLLSFDVEHAAIFRGRTRARNELREALARQEARGAAFVLVIGASGSGKSSLVKAGLVPDLQLPGMVGRVALCRYAVLRAGDGDDPVRTLAAAVLSPKALPELGALEYDVDALAAAFAAGGTPATMPIRQGLAAASKAAGVTESGEARLLVVVDQLEELFTRTTIAAGAREAFVALLETLARSGLVWVVATLRSDLFDRLEGSPTLLRLSAGEGRYVLAPPEPAEIAQMITQPAREAGLRYEIDERGGVALDTVIQEAAERQPGALPVLSFLLDQLWRHRDEHGVLRFAAYEELGGLDGSIARRADELFESLPGTVRAALPDVLRQLVATGPGTGATARAAPLAAIPVGGPSRALVDALLDPGARLLVASADGQGAHVRLAHEALLTHWRTAAEIIAADARDLALRGRLEHAARTWREAPPRHRASHLLRPGFPVAEAVDLLRRWRQSLDADVVELIVASRRAARWRVVRLTALVVAAMLSVPACALLVTTVLVWRGVRAVERDLAMVELPRGCFVMGSPEGEPDRAADEGPAHEVCVERFELAKLELTQAEWRAVMLDNPSQYVGDRLPVENVSWDDVQRFLWRMNRFGSRTYRLPSEAEWEYADRGGATTAFPWGPTLDPLGCRHANLNDATFREAAPRDPISPQAASCSDGFYRTAPVGSFEPNRAGLHDLHGNVWEWVADEYHPSYGGAPKDGAAWTTGRAHALHVLRGGSWHSVPRRLRSAQREKEPSDYRIGYIGFRLARAPRD